MTPQRADLLIAGGVVLTLDPERRILSDGAVAIGDGRILALGRTADVRAAFAPERTIDATGRLIAPGLIDGHNHPIHFLSKGISDDLPTHLRWATRVYPFEQAATEEETYTGALGNFAAMLTTGTTCFADPGGYHVDAVARAAVDAGIRGVLARSSQDLSSSSLPVPETAQESTEEALAAARELHGRWDGAADGRLHVWLGLRSVYNCSDELCRATQEAAEELGAGIHCHLCVTERENELSVEQWGCRPMERFRRLELLGPALYAVHMGAVDEREVGWLADHDVKVVHCPSASMLGGFGCITHGRFREMDAAGVTVSLGTDAGAVSRFLDMFRVMYIAATAHKDVEADPTVWGCYRALEMATIDAARALGLEGEIGSLEPGKRADVIVIDTEGADWHPNPLANPVANLIYAAAGHSVRTVVVDGQVLMEDRRLSGAAGADDLWRDCDAAATAVLNRAGIEIEPRWPVV
jgi:cytosine/adenosine deaminase-related metal-dependent hydrolase